MLTDVLDLQAGVIARRQALAAGLTANDVRRLLRRREWMAVHPGVYLGHTGDLTWLQRAWAAVLYAEPAALFGASALRAAEGPGRREHPDDGPIEVAIARDRRLAGRPGIRLQRLARLEDAVQWNRSPPRMRYEEAALEVAVRAPSEFAALEVLSRAVQSRRTTARLLLETLADRPRVRMRAWLGGVLRDLAEGSCSVLEHGYLTRVERPHRLPRPERQQRAGASTGMVYHDVSHEEGLIVELDGRLFHDTTAQRDRDFDRDLDAAVDGRQTIRLSWGQVFERPCVTAGKIGSLLQARGWTGVVQPCGPSCTLVRRLGVTG